MASWSTVQRKGKKGRRTDFHDEVQPGRPDAKAASLVDATERGFLVQVDGEEMWIAYPHECKAKSSRDLRKVAVYMHQQAFSKLGFAYRLKKGYYNKIAKMGFAILKKKASKNKEVVYPVVAAAALMGAYKLYRHMPSRS
jgi:hypothetical protein